MPMVKCNCNTFALLFTYSFIKYSYFFYNYYIIFSLQYIGKLVSFLPTHPRHTPN